MCLFFFSLATVRVEVEVSHTLLAQVSQVVHIFMYVNDKMLLFAPHEEHGKVAERALD